MGFLVLLANSAVLAPVLLGRLHRDRTAVRRWLARLLDSDDVQISDRSGKYPTALTALCRSGFLYSFQSGATSPGSRANLLGSDLEVGAADIPTATVVSKRPHAHPSSGTLRVRTRDLILDIRGRVRKRQQSIGRGETKGYSRLQSGRAVTSSTLRWAFRNGKRTGSSLGRSSQRASSYSHTDSVGATRSHSGQGWERSGSTNAQSLGAA